MAKPEIAVPRKIRKSTRFYPYFKDCVGAIDGTHILAVVSQKKKRLLFVTEKVIYRKMSHNSKVLNDALTRNSNRLLVPEGKFYVVGCGFPNRRNFLAPYRGVRYHLQEYSGQNSQPTNAKELFNHRHASLRNMVEIIFRIFKSRFLIFKSAPPFPYKTQTEIVLACVGLHNFLQKFCRTDNFLKKTKV
ncbi:putative harbinger transposase-derived nuclease domain-containing protein [Arabidopsis thaliana]